MHLQKIRKLFTGKYLGTGAFVL